MNKYRFLEKPDNEQHQKILQEIEDNLATQNDVAEKADVVKDFVTQEPVLREMADGEAREYNDGTNYWTYKRIGAKLFKNQWTEV